MQGALHYVVTVVGSGRPGRVSLVGLVFACLCLLFEGRSCLIIARSPVLYIDNAVIRFRIQ